MDETVITLKPDEATIRYDADFQRIQGLVWLPWVGQNFPGRPQHKRLLVVGESHYFRAATPEVRQEERERWLKYPQLTREVVSESLINREWTTPTLTNISKLLFKTAEIDCLKLWSDSALYNIVQRVMDYNQIGQPERPTREDFVAGWTVFAEIVRIIQPSHCLFIGVEAAKHFNGSVSCSKQVGRTWARVAKMEVGETTTELIFVQHLGKYFSWSDWHDYLQSHHVDFMGWLGTESYVTAQKV